MQTGPCCCDLTLRGFTRTAQARAWRKRGEAMRRPWRLRARGRRKRAARTTLAVTSLARSTPSQNSGMPAGAAPPPGASPAPAAIASAGGSSSPFTILARVWYSGAARARACISRRGARPQAAYFSPCTYRRPLLAKWRPARPALHWRAPLTAALRQQRRAQAGPDSCHRALRQQTT